MPQRLRTGVSRGATTVSGWQRQRLSIARTLTSDPVVHRFDGWVFEAPVRKAAHVWTSLGRPGTLLLGFKLSLAVVLVFIIGSVRIIRDLRRRVEDKLHRLHS